MTLCQIHQTYKKKNTVKKTVLVYFKKQILPIFSFLNYSINSVYVKNKFWLVSVFFCKCLNLKLTFQQQFKFMSFYTYISSPGSSSKYAMIAALRIDLPFLYQKQITLYLIFRETNFPTRQGHTTISYVRFNKK